MRLSVETLRNQKGQFMSVLTDTGHTDRTRPTKRASGDQRENLSCSFSLLVIEMTQFVCQALHMIDFQSRMNLDR